jgi:hypothetical protein
MSSAIQQSNTPMAAATTTTATTTSQTFSKEKMEPIITTTQTSQKRPLDELLLSTTAEQSKKKKSSSALPHSISLPPAIVMQSYGVTWWGRQFLQPLRNTIEERLLSQAQALADRSQIKSISVKENVVTAAVTAASPIKMRLTFHKLTADNERALSNAIQSGTALMSSLLSKRIPNSMKEVSESSVMCLFLCSSFFSFFSSYWNGHLSSQRNGLR